MRNIFLTFTFFIMSISLIKAQVSKQSDLYGTTLLVRLSTNEHLINYYLQKGDIEKANIEREKQSKKNTQIINQFRDKWQLTSVYFFYSNHSSEIQRNNFNNIFKDTKQTQLNDTEKRDLNNNFIIAYFGRTNGPLKFNALVLTNEKFESLQKPMPRHVRTYDKLGFLKRSEGKAIEILEKKLKFKKLNLK